MARPAPAPQRAAAGLMVLSALSLAAGWILDSVARGRREAKRLAYLAAGGLSDPG